MKRKQEVRKKGTGRVREERGCLRGELVLRKAQSEERIPREVYKKRSLKLSFGDYTYVGSGNARLFLKRHA